eukprot:1632496-Rhodomonas_salina.1
MSMHTASLLFALLAFHFGTCFHRDPALMQCLTLKLSADEDVCCRTRATWVTRAASPLTSRPTTRASSS